jgi:polysaccharide biosynthesis transport protein
VDLAGYLAVLRRRLVAIVLCVFAGAAGGLALAFSGHDVYQATSRTIVDMPAATQLQEALAGAQLSEHLLQTYAQVASSNALAARTAQIAGLNPADVRGSLRARVETQTFLIDITATSSSPTRAQQIANAAAQALAAEVADFEKNRPDPVTVQVLDQAGLPQVPISPRKKLDIVLGVILGLVAGLGVAAVLEALDKTLKGPGQAARAMRTQLLGAVPLFAGRRLLAVTRDGPAPAVEAFRALRTAIQFSGPGGGPRQLLVTSPSPSEGKTTVAVNVAAAMALGGSSVAVIDADLRDGAVAKAFGLPRTPGLSGVLAGRADVDTALVHHDDNLWVMTAGDPVANPAELLGSEAMAALVDRLSDFDVVVFDVPPVLSVTDAVVLAAHVDAVVLVARHAKTDRAAAVEARRRLDAVGAQVVGFVLNAVPRGEVNQFPSDDAGDVTQATPAAGALAEPARISG